MTQASRLHHVALVVNDADAALAFVPYKQEVVGSIPSAPTIRSVGLSAESYS